MTGFDVKKTENKMENTSKSWERPRDGRRGTGWTPCFPGRHLCVFCEENAKKIIAKPSENEHRNDKEWRTVAKSAARVASIRGRLPRCRRYGGRRWPCLAESTRCYSVVVHVMQREKCAHQSCSLSQRWKRQIKHWFPHRLECVCNGAPVLVDGEARQHFDIHIPLRGGSEFASVLKSLQNTDLKSWEKKRTKNTHVGNEPESRKKVKAITGSCNINSATWSSFTAWSHSGKLNVPFLGVFERSVRMKSRVLKMKTFLLKKPTYVLVNTKITQESHKNCGASVNWTKYQTILNNLHIRSQFPIKEESNKRGNLPFSHKTKQWKPSSNQQVRTGKNCLKINQSINQSIDQSVIESILQSINQAVSQSMDQKSINSSIKQSTDQVCTTWFRSWWFSFLPKSFCLKRQDYTLE